jgi:hypothetical protein
MASKEIADIDEILNMAQEDECDTWREFFKRSRGFAIHSIGQDSPSLHTAWRCLLAAASGESFFRPGRLTSTVGTTAIS